MYRKGALMVGVELALRGYTKPYEESNKTKWKCLAIKMAKLWGDSYFKFQKMRFLEKGKKLKKMDRNKDFWMR